MVAVFKMPVPVTIMGRSSSITNSFVNGIIPCVEPTEQEIDNALEVLGMSRESICCAYCGGNHTEWDHLNPLVINKAPTGYISEIHNLVPACGKCNQSKGNHGWKEWMTGDANLSPKSRGITDLEVRIARLEAYEKAFTPARIAFVDLVGEDAWEEYWSSYDKVIDAMKEAQLVAGEIKSKILQGLGASTQSTKRQNRISSERKRGANDPLPIALVPADKLEFEKSLLQHRKAIIEVHYVDGHMEKKPWKAYKFNRTSDAYNNLRSRAEFRPGVWQANGIDHIVVSVDVCE